MDLDAWKDTDKFSVKYSKSRLGNEVPFTSRQQEYVDSAAQAETTPREACSLAIIPDQP